MYFAALVLLISSAVFYAAGHHEIGSLARMYADMATRSAKIRSTF